jgi:hypothetical protein
MEAHKGELRMFEPELTRGVYEEIRTAVAKEAISQICAMLAEKHREISPLSKYSGEGFVKNTLAALQDDTTTWQECFALVKEDVASWKNHLENYTLSHCYLGLTEKRDAMNGVKKFTKDTLSIIKNFETLAPYATFTTDNREFLRGYLAATE